MERHIQADNAFLEWMEIMSKNVVHITDAWYAAVKWADSHLQWITVEEELPKCNIVDCGLATYPVLVYREDGFIDISCYDSEVGEWDCVGVVTHWMPMPQSPQGKEE